MQQLTSRRWLYMMAYRPSHTALPVNTPGGTKQISFHDSGENYQMEGKETDESTEQFRARTKKEQKKQNGKSGLWMDGSSIHQRCRVTRGQPGRATRGYLSIGLARYYSGLDTTPDRLNLGMIQATNKPLLCRITGYGVLTANNVYRRNADNISTPSHLHLSFLRSPMRRTTRRHMKMKRVAQPPSRSTYQRPFTTSYGVVCRLLCIWKGHTVGQEIRGTE